MGEPKKRVSLKKKKPSDEDSVTIRRNERTGGWVASDGDTKTVHPHPATALRRLVKETGLQGVDAKEWFEYADLKFSDEIRQVRDELVEVEARLEDLKKRRGELALEMLRMGLRSRDVANAWRLSPSWTVVLLREAMKEDEE